MTNSFLPNSNQSTLAQVLDSRVVYVLDHAENPSSQQLGNVKAFVWNTTGHFYFKLPVGSARPVDGTRVVADRDGVKFAISNDDMPKAWINVQRTPPTRPNAGDAYRVDGLATGIWATHRNTIAVWNAELNTWIYYGAEAGDIGLNMSSKAIEYHDGVTWQGHLGATNIGKGDINPLQLSDPGVIAVKGYQNAPPRTPAANGDIYIVKNGSGAFTGRNNQIARKISTGWEFEAAKPNTIFSAPAERRKYNGTTWTKVGTEVAMVGYIKQEMPLTGIVPQGEVAPNTQNSQSRALWTFTADSNVNFLEIRTTGIDLNLEVSNRHTMHGSIPRTVEFDFIIAVGGTPVTTVANQQFRAETNDPFINTRWVANEKRAVLGATAEIPFTEIDFSDYSSRTVTFSIAIPTYAVIPVRFGLNRPHFAYIDIRNVTKADGHSIIKSFIETDLTD